MIQTPFYPQHNAIATSHTHKVGSRPQKRTFITALDAKREVFEPNTSVDDKMRAKEQLINRDLAISSASLAFAMANPFVALPLGLVATGGTLYIIRSIAQEIYDNFVNEGETDARILPVLGTLGVLAGGYFTIGTASYTLVCLSQKLILKTEDRSREALINIIGERPKTVWCVQDGVEVTIPFQALRVNDIIAVAAGQMIPIDGEIVQGNATIDQQRLTGESQPVEKSVGDKVLAATVVLSGQLHICVQQTGDETVAAQIGSILEQTVDYRSGSLLRFQQISNRLTMPALAATTLATVTMGVTSGVSLLFCLPIGMVAFASALNVLGYLNKASQLGVLVKDGRALEMLQEIDTVVFDKTGTLTLEQPTVGKILVTEGFSAEIILRYAASAETKQSHPIAQAILHAAAEQTLDLFSIDHTTVKVGYGIDVQANKHRIRVGSQRFMQQSALDIPTHIIEHQMLCDAEGISLVYVAIDDELGGVIELRTTIRPEAQTVIDALKASGIQLAIISGDRKQPTQALAAQLGIDSFFAEVLPQDKSHLIEQLQAQGRNVCFIGDGINDTIALKQANASISLAGATSAATDTAQMVLMDGTLTRLPALFDLSKRFNTNTNKTIASALFLPVASIFGVFFLNTGLAAATVAFNGGSLAGVVTSLLPMREREDIESSWSFAIE